jgi:gamma-glutamyltranspeptidase/glutathione hydrolase
MVVTDNALASRVGSQVLRTGGNVADAAVATAFALAAAYPTAGNIGGGGFAVILNRGVARALDFRETAPAAANRDMYLDAEGRPKADARQGIRSAGVPGSVAGLRELADTLGSKTKSWAELLAPAIELAEKGFIVDEAFRAGIAEHAERLKQHRASSQLFLPGGAAPVLGSVWKNPALAKTLRRIAEKGADDFYRGETARQLAAQMRAEGGLVTQADLAAYRAKWREPLEFMYRDARVIAMPPPSSGGVTLAMIAHILTGMDLKQWGAQSPMALHLLFESFRRSFAARNAKLGDPDFVTMPLDELLSARWADEQRASILPNRATPSSEIVSIGGPSATGPHTTHLSIVDRDGNAIALTTTINWWYGSGVTVKEAGFVLNNEMDDFASVPGTANGYGLVQGEANAIAPGKRMLSSMSPTIVTDADGRVKLVLGAAGGPTIISTVFQELSNVVDFGLDMGAAVGLPRFHMQHLPDLVTYEKDGLNDETRQRLLGMGYTFKERDHVADAPLIGRTGDVWVGVAEPRRLGALAAAP